MSKMFIKVKPLKSQSKTFNFNIKLEKERSVRFYLEDNYMRYTILSKRRFVLLATVYWSITRQTNLSALHSLNRWTLICTLLDISPNTKLLTFVFNLLRLKTLLKIGTQQATLNNASRKLMGKTKEYRQILQEEQTPW